MRILSFGKIGYVVATLIATSASGVVAQAQLSVQPAKGQPPEQVQRDMADCQGLASQQSGYNPSQVAAQPAKPQVGGRAKGAAAGAAAGAVGAEARGRQYDNYDKAGDDAKQEYRQNEAQGAAAAGAAVGASRQRQQRRETRQTTEQQAKAASAYDTAYKSCLTPRGYVVTP